MTEVNLNTCHCPQESTRRSLFPMCILIPVSEPFPNLILSRFQPWTDQNKGIKRAVSSEGLALITELPRLAQRLRGVAAPLCTASLLTFSLPSSFQAAFGLAPVQVSLNVPHLNHKRKREAARWTLKYAACPLDLAAGLTGVTGSPGRVSS